MANTRTVRAARYPARAEDAEQAENQVQDRIDNDELDDEEWEFEGSLGGEYRQIEDVRKLEGV